MDPSYFLTVAREAMLVLALAAAPILIPALIAGVLLGMVQAATSINEATLSFVPKLVVVAVSMIVFGATIMGLLTDFTIRIFERLPDLVK
jgi:flagellar biosynthesis protein FliQ